MDQGVLFYAFGALALFSAVVVIAQRNPIYSAFALIVTLCSLSVVYAVLGSPFIAVLQIVVYAGAIMVLFLFVLMLLNVKREEHESRSRVLPLVALALVVGFVVQVGIVIGGSSRAPAAFFDATTRTMARTLFDPRFLYVFEATSFLILAALVGAVALAKKEP